MGASPLVRFVLLFLECRDTIREHVACRRIGPCLRGCDVDTRNRDLACGTLIVSPECLNTTLISHGI